MMVLFTSDGVISILLQCNLENRVPSLPFLGKVPNIPTHDF